MSEFSRNFIQIDDLVCPYPAIGFKMQTATMVNNARNANGVLVGQKVGRELQQMEIEWAHLTASVWSQILKRLSKFYIRVRYPDMVSNVWNTRTMYPGNRSAEVFKIDRNTSKPVEYIHCKVNLIDVGKNDVWAR
jgi:hypothetical protein